MKSQTAPLRKTFITVLTSMRLQSCVCSQVRCQVTLPRERLVTQVTFEWLDVAMNYQMLLQIHDPGERLATHFACKWFHISMAIYVIYQKSLHDKSLSTFITFELLFRLDSKMTACNMLTEPPCLPECHRTVWTHVILFQTVGEQMTS
jgi:hypothetical protein